MFNALKYTESLEKVGFSREQAEQSIKVLIEIMEQNLATTQDLKEVETKLSQEIGNVRVEIKEVETRLSQEIGNVRVEIKEVETRLSHEISNVRVEIKELDEKLERKIDSVKYEIRELESRMTIKLGSMLVLSIGIMTALSKI